MTYNRPPALGLDKAAGSSDSALREARRRANKLLDKYVFGNEESNPTIENVSPVTTTTIDGSVSVAKDPIFQDVAQDHELISGLMRLTIKHISEIRPLLIHGSGFVPHILDLTPYDDVVKTFELAGYRKLVMTEVATSVKQSGMLTGSSELSVIIQERVDAFGVTQALIEVYNALVSGDYISISNSTYIRHASQWTQYALDATLIYRPKSEQRDIALKWLAELTEKAQALHSRPADWILRFQGIDQKKECQVVNKCGCKGWEVCDLMNMIMLAKGKLVR